MATTVGTIRIGTAGWSILRQYSDRIAGTGTHLERYARSFSCAEINSSFYRSHRPATWSRWADSVPAGFQFSVKAPRAITHDRRLESSEEPLNGFLKEVRTLGISLGPILFQLPPKLEFEETQVTTFLALLRQLHAGPLVFEPRHPSWFTAAADQIFCKFDIARAAADPAVVPEAAKSAGSAKLVYYRLHGFPRRYYSAYGSDFLKSLAARIRTQCLKSEVWCIFDNTASGAALADALTLSQLVTSAADVDRSQPLSDS